jgi:hypothetical protein
MFQVFRFIHPLLPLIQVDGRVLLLDTGATHSLGPPLDLTSPIGRLLTAAPAWGSFALLMAAANAAWPAVEHAVRALGHDGPLDGLVGVDRLKDLDLLVDRPRGLVALRPATADGGAAGQRLASHLAQGLPVVHLRFGARDLRAVLDTGATLGYFTGNIMGVTYGPEAEDFHPLTGRFTAPTFQGPMTVALADGGQLDLGHRSMGQLTGILADSLALAGLDAAVGEALFSTSAVLLTNRLSSVHLISPQIAAALAPRGEPAS